MLDEPTAQLDPAGSRLVADALARLARGGASILIAEQKTDLLAEICHRVVVIAGGAVALEGPAAEVLADPRLDRAGGGRASRRPAAARCRCGRPAARGAGTAATGGRGMTARGAPELRLESVSHVYQQGEVRALDEVSLTIGPGEVVALVGQNGSGKTTLVRHLNGLLRPTTGRVLVDGQDAAGRTVAQLARDVGLVFQDPDRQIFAGSVRAEVEFGPRNLGLRGDELRAAVDDAMAAVGLDRGGAHQPLRPGRLAQEAAGAGLGAGHADAGAGARRADHRPGRGRRGAGAPCHGRGASGAGAP